MGDDGAGQADALLHATGDLGREQLGHGRRQAHALHGGERPLMRFATGHVLGVGEAEGHVLPHVQAVEERRALEQEAVATRQVLAPPAGEARHVLAVQHHPPGVRLHQPGGDLERDRLALARPADDHQRPARRHVQGHVLQHLAAGELLGHVQELELGPRRIGKQRLAHLVNRLVSTKSAAKISTAAETTA